MKLSSSLAICLIVLAPPAMAQATVTDAWVRGTVPGQTSSGAYMQLMSATGATLLGVTTPLAGVAEIHEMRMDGSVMRMRSVAKLPLPPGKTIELKPSGYHVMLMNLKQPLKPGDVVPLSIRVQGKDNLVTTIAVQAEVRPLSAPQTAGHGAHAH
jgi:periplasmic copper chaperone A